MKQTAKKTAKKKTKTKLPPCNKQNGYRRNSNYFLAFNLLCKFGLKKAMSRKVLIERYAALSGKQIPNASFDLAVILSPTLQADGTLTHHRSAEKATRLYPYHVIKENGQVQLFITAKTTKK